MNPSKTHDLITANDQHHELLAKYLMLMRLIDEKYLQTPVYGSRRLR
jgi:hypothetical protein